MFEPYVDAATPAVDEWTLSENLRADNAIDRIEEHYKTFITEKDFAEIAGAGLNYVRVPLPFWAVETRDDEPFLEGVAWTYFLKAIQWARKYGLRINLDLHSVVGSQNGWNHSGRLGRVNLLRGPMGVANAQRTLDHIRILAEFIAQPEYKDVVTMFGILNEPQGDQIGRDVLTAFYLEAYNIVDNAGGDTWVGLHDGFFDRESWGREGTLADLPRVTLDSHPYLIFNDQSSAPMSDRVDVPCQYWGASFNRSNQNFGLTNAGEFSNAVTDCALFLNGVGLGTRYEGEYAPESWRPRMGDCEEWRDWTRYTDDTKDALRRFAMASMDALQNYFFWTWKIGNSSVTGKVESPDWSYQLGLENGWMPTDPRDAAGACNNANPRDRPMHTGDGADVPTDQFPWPPATIIGFNVADLPTLTPTGTVPTLTGSVPAGAAATVDVGDGWANDRDTEGLHVPVEGCSYLDPWVGPTAAPPSPLCS